MFWENIDINMHNPHEIGITLFYSQQSKLELHNGFIPDDAASQGPT